MKRLLLLAGTLALSPAVGAAAIRELRVAADKLADGIIPEIRKLDGKVGVLDFMTYSGKDAVTSELGRELARQILNKLVGRKRRKDSYTVVDREQLVRIMDDATLWGDKPELYSQLRVKAGMDYLVSGTYTIFDERVSVLAQLVRAEDGHVLASKEADIPVTPGIDKLAGGRVRLGRGAEEEGEAEGAPESGKEISLDVGVVYLGADGLLRLVHEGMVLTSQHRYGVFLKPAQNCHVYVYQAGPSGSVTRLFPNGDFNTGENPVKAGRGRWIPNDKGLFYLDKNTGTETIYIVAARKEIPGLRRLVQAQAAALDEQMEPLRKLMDVGGVENIRVHRRIKLDGKERDVLAQNLGAPGNFVHEISFEHR